VNREAKVTAVSQFHTKLVFIEMPKPLLALSISRKDPRSPKFLLEALELVGRECIYRADVFESPEELES